MAKRLIHVNSRATLLGLATLLVLYGSVTARAAQDKLSTFLPAESLITVEYVGWAELKIGGAGDSTFGRMLAHQEMQRFGTELATAVKAALKKEADGNPEKTAATDSVFALINQVLVHGAAAALVDVEDSASGPMPQLIVVVEAGDQADQVREHVERLVSLLPRVAPPADEVIDTITFKRFELPAPLRVGVIDQHVVVTFGEQTTRILLDAKASQATDLPQAKRLQAAMSKIGTKDRILMTRVHVNVGDLLQSARQISQKTNDEAGLPLPVEAFLRESGINDWQSLTWTTQFADGGFRHSVFVAAAGPAKGITKIFKAPLLTQDDLLPVPMDATFCQVSNLKRQVIFDEVMSILGNGAPFLRMMFEAALAEIEVQVGVQLRTEVLPLFEGTEVFFNAPSSGGLLVTGMTFSVETSQTAKFDELIRRLIDRLQAEVSPDVRLKIRSYEHAGNQINYLMVQQAAVPIAPAWAAVGERFIIALYPQMVAQTVDRLASPVAASRSILENRDFIRARKLLPDNCVLLGYSDTRKVMEDWYAVLLPSLCAVCLAVSDQDIEMNIAMLPRRDVLTRDLFGDVWGISSDQEGILAVGHGPLPVMVPSFSFVAPFLIGGIMGEIVRQEAGHQPNDLDELFPLPVDAPVPPAPTPATTPDVPVEPSQDPASSSSATGDLSSG